MIKIFSKAHQALIVFGVASLSLTGQADAQAIERHTPEAPPGFHHEVIAAPNVVPADQDDRPIGPNLHAIRLLGPTEPIAATVPDGVSVSAVERLSNSDAQAKIASTLAPFLNQPISRKLIAQIEAAIASHFREIHYPFVSLSTPEQEVDRGVLQIRVIEFKLGNVSLRGTLSDDDADSITDRLDMKSGDPINSQTLSQQLDWINHYPFRQLQAVFSPGATLGTTELSLQATNARPWQAYAGYTNDGSSATDRDRVFMGGAVGDLLLPDSVTAVQLTGSPDGIAAKRYPHYQSAALTYEAPVGLGRIESVFDWVRTDQSAQGFVTGTNVLEGSVGYRLPLEDNWLGDADTDVRVGIEGNRQTRSIYFAGTKVFQVAMNVAQVYLGLQQTQADWGNWDVSLHVSPGGVTGANSDGQVFRYTLGRMKDATYAYVNFDYNDQADIGFAEWTGELIGQYSPDVLPFTAQSGLGSMSLVRGYSSENGAFDSAVVFRNELRFTAASLAGAGLAPYGFLDGGVGRDNYFKQDGSAASVGAGFRLHAVDHIMLNALGGVALARNNNVDAGDAFVRVNVSIDL